MSSLSFVPSVVLLKIKRPATYFFVGQFRDGLYVRNHLDFASPRALIGERTSTDIWHASRKPLK